MAQSTLKSGYEAKETTFRLLMAVVEQMEQADSDGDFIRIKKLANIGYYLADLAHTSRNRDRDREHVETDYDAAAIRNCTDDLYTMQQASEKFPTLTPLLEDKTWRILYDLRTLFLRAESPKPAPVPEPLGTVVAVTTVEDVPSTVEPPTGEDAPDDSMDPVTTGGVPN